jgi:membrane-associated phospholipid phosphatase
VPAEKDGPGGERGADPRRRRRSGARPDLARPPEIRYCVRVALRAERIALIALLFAVAMVVTLRWWLPIDEWVYQWVQFHRSCAMDAWSHRLDPVVRTTLALLIGFALAHGEWRHPGRLLGLLIVFLVGAFGVELLKTVIDRLRPNATPDMIGGNSFPSGHTTGAAMAAVIAIVLVRRRNWPRSTRWSAYLLAGACVVVQAAGRLLGGSHWVSDVVASAFLGVAWVLGAGWIRRLPRTLVAGSLAVACVAFFVFDDVPRARVRLPSALDESSQSLAAVEFGTAEARSARVGLWQDGPAEPIGPVSWALSPDVGVGLRVGSDANVVLKMTLRPAAAGEERGSCARLVISVNEWVAPEIALTRGWREYHLDPPPGVIRAGSNTVRFHISTDATASGRLAAFRYLRVFPRA